MTFAGSIFLFALGAIVRFATHLHVKGRDLRTIGLISGEHRDPPGC